MNRRLCSCENGFHCSFYQFLQLQTQTFIAMAAWHGDSVLCLNVEDGAFFVTAQEHLHTHNGWDGFDFLNCLLLYRNPQHCLKQKGHNQVMPVCWVSQQQHWKFCYILWPRFKVRHSSYKLIIPLHTCNWSFRLFAKNAEWLYFDIFSKVPTFSCSAEWAQSAVSWLIGQMNNLL